MVVKEILYMTVNTRVNISSLALEMSFNSIQNNMKQQLQCI